MLQRGVLHICSGGLFKTIWEKEKLLVTSHYSISHSVFNPLENFDIFIEFKIVICKLFHFETVENLFFGIGLNLILIKHSSHNYVLQRYVANISGLKKKCWISKTKDSGYIPPNTKESQIISSKLYFT